VQGNISLHEKHSQEDFVKNIRKYLMASALPADASPDVLIWPETVIMQLLSEDIRHVSEHPTLSAIHQELLEYFNPRGKVPHLLFGSLSHNKNREVMNSAFFIAANGEVHRPYHKNILMPFGEFTPFSEIFPFLKTLNSNVADFARGAGPVIFPNEGAPLPGILKLSPLICYEDVVGWLASEAVAAGAQVLVNLTNDAWFGRSPASRQHHLIASFRAIETGRPLIRSTNTGFSAVVDQSGRTLSYLEPFERSSFDQRIFLTTKTTPYQMGLGKGYSLAVLFVFVSILSFALVLPSKNSRNSH
jgi:apolipoprotein N-acyltransferase